MGKKKKPNKPRIRNLSAEEMPESKHFGVRFEDETDAHKALEAFLKEAEGKDLVAEKLADVPKPNPFPRKRQKSRDKSGAGQAEETRVDLHRLTVAEATARIDAEFSAATFDRNSRTFVIITGKGRHSSGGKGILAKEIHSYVVTRYRARIISVDDSPADLEVNGVPFVGHFRVTLKGV